MTKSPKMDLSAFILYSNLFVFGMSACLYGLCRIFDKVSTSKKNSESYKSFKHTSEPVFDFVNTYDSSDIQQIMDLEFNSKNSKE